MEKIAIIIPVYNASHYLEECINSVINQTYNDIEIIIVNDGSTDSSEEIILSFEEMDKRIKYIKIRNSGVSTARNTGLALASSKYVMFVDSDDVIEECQVEKLADRIDSCDLTMTGYTVLKVSSKKKEEYHCVPYEGETKQFINEISMYLMPPLLLSPCFKLFKLSIIKEKFIEFPTNMSFGEDAEFVLTYLESTKRVICIDYNGYIYRKYGNHTLSSKFRADKMGVHNRLHKHMLELMHIYDAHDSVAELNHRYIQNYVEYVRELFSSHLNFKDKKRLFYESGNKFKIVSLCKLDEKLTAAQKLIQWGIEYKIFYIVYWTFVLQNKIVYV